MAGLAGLSILAFGIFLGLMWTVRDVGYDVLPLRSGDAFGNLLSQVVNILRDDFLDPLIALGV